MVSNKTMIFKLIALFALVFFASQAFAQSYSGIEIMPENQGIFMSKNDNVGILYTFINNSNENKCMDISIFPSSNYVTASFPENHLCLNKGQRTSMALSVRTIDAPRADYAVGLLLIVNNNSYNIALVKITVGDNPILEIIPYETDICRGREEFVNVLIRNQTPFFLPVQLNAENEALLPNFEENKIYLDSFQEKNVKLFVHTSRLTSLGAKEVSIYATIPNQDYIKKITQINVKDCEGIERPAFEVELSSGCIEVEKTKKSSIYFSIRNLLDSEQTMNIAVESDLPNALSNSSVVLSAFEQRTLSFDINARISDANIDHNVSLIIWNEKQRIEKSKCVRVRPIDLIEVELQNNNITVEQGKSNSFVLTVKNIGDFDQNIDLNISNIPANITINFSENKFRLNAKQQKDVFLFVSAAESAEIKKYDLNITTKAKYKTIQQKASFKVTEKTSEIEEDWIIESYPLQIQAEKNTEKTISIKLKNNSNKIIDGIDLRIANLPNSISPSSAKGISLNPSESKNIPLTLTIGNASVGNYSAILEAKTLDSVKTKQIEIVIAAGGATEQEEEEKPGIFAGLFALGQSISLGTALLSVIIILLLVLAIIGFSAPRQERVVWLRK